MILTSLHPTSMVSVKNKSSVRLALNIANDDQSPKANHEITWMVTGDHAVVDKKITITNENGTAENNITVDATEAPCAGEIFIKAASTEVYRIGRWYAIVEDEERTLYFIPHISGVKLPAPERLAANASTRSDGGNTLTIHYPYPNSVMPYSTIFSVWVRYVDGSGSGIADQSVIPEMSGDFKLASQGPYFTDANGWASILVTTVGQINQYDLGPEGNSPPDGDSYGKINVSIYQASATDSLSLHASASAGGPGLIDYDIIPVMPSLDRKNNNLVLLKLRYRNCDGTPAVYRELTLNFFSVYAPNTLYPDMITDASGSTYNLLQVFSGEKTVFILQAPNAYGATGKDEFLCRFDPAPFGQLRYRGYLDSVYRHDDNYGGKVPAGVYNQPTLLRVKYVPYMQQESAVGKTVIFSSPDARIKVDPSRNTIDQQGGSWGGLSANSTTDEIFTAPIIYQAIDENSGEVLASGADLLSFFNPDTWRYWKQKAQGKVTIRSDDHSGMFEDNVPKRFNVTCLHADNTPMAHCMVQITLRLGRRGALGSEKLVTLDPPAPLETDDHGKAYFTATAPYMAQQAQIWLDARTYNPLTAQYDTGSFAAYTAMKQNLVVPVTVTALETPPLTLNASHKLNAACLLSTNQPAKHVQVLWSAIPADFVEFMPLSTSTNDRGVAEVEITAWGGDERPDVTVYARFYDDTAKQWQVGMLPLAWKAGEQPAPQQGFIELLSLDGTPVLSGEPHLLKATYIELDTGLPLVDQPIDWTLTPVNGIELESATTRTNGDGMTSNVALGSLKSGPESLINITASATNPVTGKRESSTLPVLFSKTPVQLPGADHLQLNANNGSPFMDEGKQYSVVATYTNADGTPAQGQNIYWAAYPAERVVFTESSQQTNEFGEASTTVIGYGPGDIDGAILSASAENEITGTNDAAHLFVNFVDASPVQPWSGIELNTAFANNPPVGLVVNPQKQQQIIKAKMTTRKPDESLVLTVYPAHPSLKIFNEQGELLPKSDRGYTATSGADGNVTVLVGSQNPALCKLQAAIENETPLVTPLVIATVSRDFAGAVPAPLVRDIIEDNLTIPLANKGNSTTFRLYIPSLIGFDGTDMLTVIVNNRLAYLDTFNQAQKAGIDIAYALLNPGVKNQIAYLINRGSTVYESAILSFTVTGTAQINPDSSVTRTLPAPVLSSSQRIIDSREIINGVTVLIEPYSFIQEKDIIEVCFYLSGQDRVSGKTINNIAKYNYTVQRGDLLTAGQPLPVVLPQALAAGYGGSNGTLKVDYAVTNSVGVISWSQFIRYELQTSF